MRSGNVTSRGNERKEIFRDDVDRERFLAVLGRVVERFRWALHAYVLMGTTAGQQQDLAAQAEAISTVLSGRAKIKT